MSYEFFKTASGCVNHGRLWFGAGAVVTFVLGFALAPGWWVFSFFFGLLAAMSGHFNGNPDALEYDRWLATSPVSCDLRARFLWHKD